MEDGSGVTPVRKVVVHRQVPAPRRPRAARAQRSLSGLRRAFTPPEFTDPGFSAPGRGVRTWGGFLAPWRLVAVGVIGLTRKGGVKAAQPQEEA